MVGRLRVVNVRGRRNPRCVDLEVDNMALRRVYKKKISMDEPDKREL